MLPERNANFVLFERGTPFGMIHLHRHKSNIRFHFATNVSIAPVFSHALSLVFFLGGGVLELFAKSTQNTKKLTRVEMR